MIYALTICDIEITHILAIIDNKQTCIANKSTLKKLTLGILS